MTDSESRYSFSCPSCGGSFSILLEKIPPVQARFSCPKCGKPMDFPSREEARIYIRLQAEGGAAALPAPPPQAPPSSPKAKPAAPAEPPAPAAEKTYSVDKKGFENDVYDRRAMRNLIRAGGLLENDWVRLDSEPPRRAGDFAELKSLFELRKSLRTEPPPVCRKHTDRVAHYTCVDTGRPLCEECAPEKKFGNASIRVCDHCGGTSQEIPLQLEP